MESAPNPPANPTPVSAPAPETKQTMNPPAPATAAAPSQWPNRARFALYSVGALVVMYILSAYIFVPAAWRQFYGRIPKMDDIPKTTSTKDGIPGDPLNISLVGSEEEIVAIMEKAGWKKPDPITIKSSVKIGVATVAKRRYETAPMSNLYLFGRKQDLAFQFAMKNAGQRHHVRFWKSDEVDDEGRTIWVGAATYDVSGGVSHTTGQPTHHIEADIDKERNKLLKDLQDTGLLDDVVWLEDFHLVREGHNGGGDLYRTDGRMAVAIIRLQNDDE